MIEILKEKYKWAALNCVNCQSNDDVKILRLQYEDQSGSVIPLCRDCRAKLMQLLICDANSSN